jgi:hypothetical protein
MRGSSADGSRAARGHGGNGFGGSLRGAIVVSLVALCALPAAASAYQQQGPPLAAPSSNSGTAYEHVGISGDGGTAVVAGPQNGRAKVYVRSGSTWTLQANLSAIAGTQQFPADVAISGDGNTILLSQPVGNEGIGAVLVFTRTGSTWTQTATLAAEEEFELEGSPQFGHSVALSADGSTAVIGGPTESAEGPEEGNVWVFTHNESGWHQQGPRLNVPTAPVLLGKSVSVSADGSRLIAAAAGEAYTFERTGEAWSQVGGGLTSGLTGSQYGTSTALSAEGDTALVGAPKAAKAFPYAWSGESFVQQGEALAGAEGSRFGQGVALSSDGNTALIGEPDAVPKPEHAGAVAIFRRSGETWAQEGAAFGGREGNDPGAEGFGGSVAMSADGSTLIVGGNEQDGQAWVFVPGTEPPPPPPPTVTTGSASGITEASATVAGTVNPQGAPTNCSFQYGPIKEGESSETYGHTAPCSSSPGAGTTTVNVHATLSGLSAAGNYHYRLLATNEGGMSYGTEHFFRTAAGPVITKLTPSKGAASGGYTVVVKGSGFASVDHVRLGATEVPSFTVNPNGLEIKMSVPPVEAGKLDLTVETSAGATNAPGGKAVFKVKPKLLEVTPNSAPVLEQRTVTVKGEGFVVGDEVDRFEFNKVLATSVECPTHQECTMVERGSPVKGKAGPVTLLVELPDGTKATGKGLFTFTP